MSITVNVWPNNKSPFRGVQNPSGHASMECKGETNFYISWRQANGWVDANFLGNYSKGQNEYNRVQQNDLAYSPKSIHHDGAKEFGANAGANLKNGAVPFAVTLPKYAWNNIGNYEFGTEPNENLGDPKNLWVQMPTMITTIPVFNIYPHDWPDGLPKGIGLNPYLIRYWWNGFNEGTGDNQRDIGFERKVQEYKCDSRFLNAASVVGRALDYGGAAWFFEQSFSQDRYHFYNTPHNVHHYATELNKRINAYRVFIKTLHDLPIEGIKEDQWPQDATLPSVEGWKKQSFVEAKWYKTARRIEQVLAIDKELAVYWATHENSITDEEKKTNNAQNENDLNSLRVIELAEAISNKKIAAGHFKAHIKKLQTPIIAKKINKKYPLDKLASCFKMLRLVKEHVEKKPTSDRRNAVLWLGKRIANEIDLLQTGLASNPRMMINNKPLNAIKQKYNGR